MFSVVIPLYNKEDCIEKTLQSVLNQSYPDFEVIVVDDGSTDSSAEIVSNIPDHRIRLISQHNGGPSSARNTGIQHANGEFIAFIDADDIWNLDYLQEMIQLIEDFPDADIYGFNYGIIENGETIIDKKADYYRGYVSPKWNNFPFFFWTSASCCRTKVIIGLQGFDERMMYGEDLDMWFRLLLNGRGVMDTRIMAYYFKDANSSLTQYNMPLEKHIPFYMDKYDEARDNNADFRRFFDQQMVYRLYPYLFNEKYKKQAKELGKRIDYSLLKKSMKFRMKFPYIYRLFRSAKAISSGQ